VILPSFLILQNNIERVDDAGNVSGRLLVSPQMTDRLLRGSLPKDGEQNVDEEVAAAATLKEDTERREDDGKDDLADVAVKNGE
jgi:hypothetical protein